MHNHSKAKQKLTLALDESGAVAVYFVLIFSTLCALAGLAIDLGNMVKVKAELQRTADAAALAGAAGLVPYTNPGPNTQTPNWPNGLAKAHTMISNVANKADNLQFSTAEGTVDYGYWLLLPPASYVQPPAGGLPKARPTTAAYEPVPAIQASLSRNVSLYLAPLVGITSPKAVSAQAIAILPEAYNFSTSQVPPIAVGWDTVYDNVGGTVQIDVAEETIKPQSNKGIAGWFNLNGGNNPGSTTAAPLTAGNFTEGTSIYLMPGTMAVLMDYVQANTTVIVPVVQNVENKAWSPIIGFAAFYVDSVSANSMTGHFVNQYFDPSVVPTPAPVTGTIGAVAGTPKLVSP
jgi:hypothetical protein